MKKLSILLCSILLITSLSCKKSQTAATTLQVNVTDGDNGAPAASANIYVYDSMTAVKGNLPKYTATTDQNGVAKITIAFLSQYFVLAQKSQEVNYDNGYIPIGIYKSQTDIQSSPFKEGAYVGGVKYQDTNGDGIINTADETVCPSVSITANTNNTFSTTIY